MFGVYMNLKYVLSILLIGIVFLNSQTQTRHYYNVQNMDSIYVFSSNDQFTFVSSSGVSSNFQLLSYIKGNYTSQTKFALGNTHFLIQGGDTLYSYDIRNVFSPYKNAFKVLGFNVDEIESFGPYFVIRSNQIVKLIQILNDTIVIKEDSLMTNNLNLYHYPYIYKYNGKIFKYLENFGVYQYYAIPETAVRFVFIGGDKLFYHYVIPRDPLPPSICSLIGRELIEPDFPITFDINNWADCALPFTSIFRSGSEKFVYLSNSIGEKILSINGEIIYTHTDLNYSVKLTDNYVFLLDTNILYSPPNSNLVFSELSLVTNIDDLALEGHSYFLNQNYPNPFNSSTSISFYCPRQTDVQLYVLNILGEKIVTLFDREVTAGYYNVTFNTANSVFENRELSSGIYFCVIKFDNIVQIKKMMLLK